MVLFAGDSVGWLHIRAPAVDAANPSYRTHQGEGGALRGGQLFLMVGILQLLGGRLVEPVVGSPLGRCGIPVAHLLHGRFWGAVRKDNAICTEIVVGGTLAKITAVAQHPAAQGIGDGAGDAGPLGLPGKPQPGGRGCRW